MRNRSAQPRRQRRAQLSHWCRSRRWKYEAEFMLTQTKSPALAGTSEPGLKNTSRTDPTKPKLKWKRVLAALYGGRSLNRFQAELHLFDHCLHSTASFLQSKGLVILRR